MSTTSPTVASNRSGGAGARRVVGWARRSLGIVGVVLTFLAVVSVLDGYGIIGLQRQYETPLVVDVTSRQRAFVERYIKDVTLKVEGVAADPAEDAAALTSAADGLLRGGMVPSPQGNLNDLVSVPRPANGTIQLKLAHERDLIHSLVAHGNALLREGRHAPSFAPDLRTLRITGAQLSSVTGDAAGEEARVAKSDLANLVRIQIMLGALGAAAAIGMAFMLQRSARRQSGRFRSLVHNSSDLITVVDEHAIATYQSPSARRVLGYDPSEVVGTKLTTLLHPSDTGRVVKTFADLDGRPDETVELTFRLRHRDGNWVTMEGTVRNLLADGTVGGFVVNTRDVTDRVHAAEELAAARDAAMEATRLKSEFLASMSHEIRTPMNAVIGLNELLLGTSLDREQHEYAAGVGNAADGLLSIINDILDFSKIEAGKLTIETVDFDLGAVLEDVVALLGDAAQHKGLELLAHPYPALPTQVRGDPTRLRQVLVNLVSNAIKFTTDGEIVARAIPVRNDGRTAVIRFEVTDTGIGIAADDQRRMFEPFSQADASTTRRFGGTGLGLAIVRQLVELMGGQLGLDSEIDQGSTFWFELPFAHQHATTARPPVDPVAFGALRALIVDDNATNRLILRQQLSSWGLRPDEAENGAAALEQIRAATADGAPYELAILDLNMPGMDGLELARTIKADVTTASLKLFLLSSSGRVDHDTAIGAGLAGTLTKPARQSELFNCLIEGLAMQPNAPETAPPIANSTTTADGTRDRGVVLLVEDNHMNQLVATRMLAKLGYRVDVANNGREAIDALAVGSYDAVLMDCQMPVMDGYEATRHLRDAESGTTRHLPIIAMTAAAMQGDREACLAAGMDDYITKPVSGDTINEALNRWITPKAPAALPSVAGHAATEDPILDPERLAVLRDLDTGDGELIGMLVHEFLNDGGRLLNELRAAAAEGDPQAVERAAHTLKGASANLGAVRLTRVCNNLEALGRAAALGTAPRLVDQAITAFEDVRTALTLQIATT